MVVRRRLAEPLALALSLVDAKRNLRIDDDETHLDDQITTWIHGVTSALEHKTGQCVMGQDWLLADTQFLPEINLPHPVISVTSVEYLDVMGNMQSLPLAAVRLVRRQYASLLLPARGTQWPQTMADPEAVMITVRSGYGESAEQVPRGMKLYLLAKLAEQFDPATRVQRDQTSDTVQAKFTEHLLDQYWIPQ